MRMNLLSIVIDLKIHSTLSSQKNKVLNEEKLCIIFDILLKAEMPKTNIVVVVVQIMIPFRALEALVAFGVMD